MSVDFGMFAYLVFVIFAQAPSKDCTCGKNLSEGNRIVGGAPAEDVSTEGSIKKCNYFRIVIDGEGYFVATCVVNSPQFACLNDRSSPRIRIKFFLV